LSAIPSFFTLSLRIAISSQLTVCYVLGLIIIFLFRGSTRKEPMGLLLNGSMSNELRLYRISIAVLLKDPRYLSAYACSRDIIPARRGNFCSAFNSLVKYLTRDLQSMDLSLQLCLQLFMSIVKSSHLDLISMGPLLPTYHISNSGLRAKPCGTREALYRRITQERKPEGIQLSVSSHGLPRQENVGLYH
jgi:hypothetical protein